MRFDKGFVSPNDSRNSALATKNIETIKREDSAKIKKPHISSETKLSIEVDSKQIKKGFFGVDENYPVSVQNKAKTTKGGKSQAGGHPSRMDGFSVSGNSINMLGNEAVGLGFSKFKNENYSGTELVNPGIKIIASVNRMRINLPNMEEFKPKKDTKA